MGAAAFAVPLARLAKAGGRRPALATGMLIALVGVALVVVHPSAIVETPVLLVAGFCLFEGSLALLSLMAAAGRPQPKWLS